MKIKLLGRRITLAEKEEDSFKISLFQTIKHFFKNEKKMQVEITL